MTTGARQHHRKATVTQCTLICLKLSIQARLCENRLQCGLSASHLAVSGNIPIQCSCSGRWLRVDSLRCQVPASQGLDALQLSERPSMSTVPCSTCLKCLIFIPFCALQRASVYLRFSRYSAMSSFSGMPAGVELSAAFKRSALDDFQNALKEATATREAEPNDENSERKVRRKIGRADQM